MKMHSDGTITALILEKGEPVHESLKQVARDLKLPGAFVTGLGVIKDVTIAFFHIELKNYKEMKLKGAVEMLSLNGSISWEGDEPVIHLHAVLGFEDGSVMGGHLLGANIGVTGEIFIHKTGERLERGMVEEFNLSLIK
ncbi:MAG: DNA-binding protein [Desulfobacteraceae bacterium]|nr:DNA-binding protein [Desulfobacteraceae bacterium]